MLCQSTNVDEEKPNALEKKKLSIVVEVKLNEVL